MCDVLKDCRIKVAIAYDSLQRALQNLWSAEDAAYARSQLERAVRYIQEAIVRSRVSEVLDTPLYELGGES